MRKPWAFWACCSRNQALVKGCLQLVQLFFTLPYHLRVSGTRACELGPTIAVRYAYEPQGIVEGHGTLRQEGQCVGVSRGPERWRLRV
ncbi:hypothetical protein EYF80_018526 [Liparis tanakae]|uniref:Secreted protein n=1 Tax=Liparis tanakae TaxID=230148 RepID=A0A4Z2HZS5_9TELE|nr:hypothetical protein EYF80_018526 [Liparis tanakae]